MNNRKPTLSIVTGDFNAKSYSWWSNDINTIARSKLLALSFSNDFSELVNEPTHIHTNSTSYTDLIYTDQPGLLVDSGVHSSLYPNCYHQIIYSAFDSPSPHLHHIND